MQLNPKLRKQNSRDKDMWQSQLLLAAKWEGGDSVREGDVPQPIKLFRFPDFSTSTKSTCIQLPDSPPPCSQELGNSMVEKSNQSSNGCRFDFHPSPETFSFQINPRSSLYIHKCHRFDYLMKHWWLEDLTECHWWHHVIHPWGTFRRALMNYGRVW